MTVDSSSLRRRLDGRHAIASAGLGAASLVGAAALSTWLGDRLVLLGSFDLELAVGGLVVVAVWCLAVIPF